MVPFNMENELKNIRFLVGKGPNKILKRVVPKRLLDIAGRTAWIDKKLSGLTASEIRQKASLFAVETDTEIKRLDRLIKKAEYDKSNKSMTTYELSLTEIEARQLAILYYWDQDEKRRGVIQYSIDDDNPNFVDVMQEASMDVSRAIRDVNEINILRDNRALSILSNAGLIKPVPKSFSEKQKCFSLIQSNDQYRFLCKLLDRAELELVNQRMQSLTDTKHKYLEDKFFTNSSRIQTTNFNSVIAQANMQVEAHVKTINELVKAFLAYKKEEVTNSRYNQFKIPSRVVKEFFGGETPINQINDETVMEMKEFLPEIPAHVTKRFPGKTLKEASELYLETNGEKAHRYDEAKKNLSAIGQIFKFSKQRKWAGSCNPIEGLQIDVPKAYKKRNFERKQEGYAPYSNKDLATIFSSMVYTAEIGRSYFPNGEKKKTKVGQIIRDQMYWAPLLALWTGARMNEILQLERADVLQEDGCFYIHVTDEEELEYRYDNFEKRVKNPNAVRDIPLHPFIVELGFIEWAWKTKKGRIFPDAHRGTAEKPSLTFSKNYRYHCEKNLGVWQKHKKVFHSFRNNFNDELRNSGVKMEMRTAINGWEEQQKMDGIYGRGHKIKMLFNEGIKNVSYDQIDWTAVKSSKELLQI